MKEVNIFIPKKICVGFQEIPPELVKHGFHYYDKYGILTYRDEKNRIRKEGTWLNSCTPKIPTEEYDNNVMENLYLNRTKGDAKKITLSNLGYCMYHGNRLTLTDDRGFEWQITNMNLMYLFNQGVKVDKDYKLIGKFIYAVNRYGDLMLISCDSEDYKEGVEYTNKLYGKYITGKELIPGYTYLDKDCSKYVYIGKFDQYEDHVDYSTKKVTSNSKGKYFYFANIYDVGEKEYFRWYIVKSISKKFIGYEDEKNAEKKLLKYKEALKQNTIFNRFDNKKDIYLDVDYEFIKETVDFFNNDHDNMMASLKLCADEKLSIYNISEKSSNEFYSKYCDSYFEFKKNLSDEYTVRVASPGRGFVHLDINKFLEEHTLKLTEKYLESGEFHKKSCYYSNKKNEWEEFVTKIVENNDLELLKKFIKNSGKDGYTALHIQKDFLLRYAFKLNKEDVFKYLLEEYRKMDYDLLASVSCVNGDKMNELMDYLIENY